MSSTIIGTPEWEFKEFLHGIAGLTKSKVAVILCATLIDLINDDKIKEQKDEYWRELIDELRTALSREGVQMEIAGIDLFVIQNNDSTFY